MLKQYFFLHKYRAISSILFILIPFSIFVLIISSSLITSRRTTSSRAEEAKPEHCTIAPKQTQRLGQCLQPCDKNSKCYRTSDKVNCPNDTYNTADTTDWQLIAYTTTGDNQCICISQKMIDTCNGVVDTQPTTPTPTQGVESETTTPTVTQGVESTTPTPSTGSDTSAIVCPEGENKNTGKPLKKGDVYFGDTCDYIGPEGIQQAINNAPSQYSLDESTDFEPFKDPTDPSKIDSDTLVPKSAPPSQTPYRILIKRGYYVIVPGSYQRLEVNKKQNIMIEGEREGGENSQPLTIITQKYTNELDEAFSIQPTINIQAQQAEQELERYKYYFTEPSRMPTLQALEDTLARKKEVNKMLREAQRLFLFEIKVSRNITVSSLYALKATGNGFNIIYSTNIHIVHNFSRLNKSYGIILYKSSGTLTGNTVSENVANGIYLDDSSGTLTGNTLSGDGSGIYLYNKSSGVLNKNKTYENEFFGICIDSLSNATLTGNTVSGNNRYGIHLDRKSSGTLTGNTVSGNGQHGIYLYSSSGTLTGNTASGNGQHGIYLDSSSGTLTGNTASGNNQYGIYLYDKSSGVLNENQIYDNKIHGIHLNSSEATLTGNTIHKNQYYGIHLANSKLTAYKNIFEGTSKDESVAIYLDNSQLSVPPNSRSSYPFTFSPDNTYICTKPLFSVGEDSSYPKDFLSNTYVGDCP